MHRLNENVIIYDNGETLNNGRLTSTIMSVYRGLTQNYTGTNVKHIPPPNKFKHSPYFKVISWQKNYQTFFQNFS